MTNTHVNIQVIFDVNEPLPPARQLQQAVDQLNQIAPWSQALMAAASLSESLSESVRLLGLDAEFGNKEAATQGLLLRETEVCGCDQSVVGALHVQGLTCVCRSKFPIRFCSLT